MKKTKIVFKICGIILLVLAALIIMLFLWISLKKAVPGKYWNKLETGGTIEKAYARLGDYTVKTRKYDAPDEPGYEGKERFYEVWYPEEEGTYPLVILINGTGIPCNKYDDVFKHIASFGYVVIGSNYEVSWDGKYTSAALDFALSTEEVSGMVDGNKIAVGGHSQGGMGTFNAITEYENGSMYDVAFSISPTNKELGIALGWGFDLDTENAYAFHPDEIDIPVMLLSGTGSFDSETVIPFDKLQTYYDEINSDKVLFRKTNIDHGDMLYQANAYIIAWLDFYLKDAVQNRAAFYGADAELGRNPLYQDFSSYRR